MYKYLCQEVQIRSRLRTWIRKKRLFLETHTKRQVALHGFLPSLLGDGYTGIEKVCGEEKIFYWADQSSQCRTKISCACTTSPTNQLRKELKDPAICTLWVPIHLIFNFQYGYPSLVPLVILYPDLTSPNSYFWIQPGPDPRLMIIVYNILL